MTANIIMPSLYKRGANVIKEIGPFLQGKATNVHIIGGKTALKVVSEEIEKSLTSKKIKICGTSWYGGECTLENIDALKSEVEASKADFIIIVGGGKALDTGKGVATKLKMPYVTVPTIAATCAAITPLSVVYNAEGVYTESLALDSCPTGVFVDTKILANAPEKWIFAGMGDTLAKWYELRATTSKIPANSLTIGGITNGRICYEIISKFGPDAKVAAQNKVVNEALENVVDAIIFYAASSSILGGEKCRGAAAHAIYTGFTNIETAHGIGHGLLVGFGNLCLLVLEQRNEEDILTEMRLARACGIPTSLNEITELSEDDVYVISEVVDIK